MDFGFCRRVIGLAQLIIFVSLLPFSVQAAGAEGSGSQTVLAGDIGDQISLNSRPIRVIRADEAGTDPAYFYEQFGSEPVIIKGVYSDSKLLKGLNSDTVTTLFKGQELDAYEKHSGQRVAISADTFLEDIRKGVSRYNVVDHPIGKSPFAKKIGAPAFLNDNWLVNSGMNTDRYELSLIFSARGTFTPLHVDSFGMQAWMYLVYGKKHWVMFPPNQVPAVFDPEFKRFYNPRVDPASSFPLAPYAKNYVATIEAGDLIFFPPGWAHQVVTEEESFGLGGSIVNEFLMPESVKSWNIDRSYSEAGDLDLKKLIENLAPFRVRTERGEKRVREALERTERWDLESSR